MSKKIVVYAIASLLAALPSSFAFLFFFHPIRNINFLLALIVSGMIFSIYFIIGYSGFTEPLKKLDIWKKIFCFLITGIISGLLLIGIIGDQNYLADNSWWIKGFVYTGTYAVFYAAILLFISLLFQINSTVNKEHQNLNRWNILLYSVPHIVVWLFYLIAFYPALMTRDSFSQWDQTVSGNFGDWHPVPHTWFIMGIKNIWDSPASVALSQIVILSLILGYTMYSLDRAGVKRRYVWLFNSIIALSPINGIYSVTLWKDILYSAFLLLFCTILFNLYVTGGQWLKRNHHVVLFIITSLGVIFFRHNGFPVFVITLLCTCIVFRNEIGRLLFIFVFAVTTYLVITGPVYAYLNVTPSDPNEKLAIPTQQIGTIIAKNGVMTEEQKAYLNQLLPFHIWKKNFHPYSVDRVKFSYEFNRELIYKDPAKFYKVWLDLCKQNPLLAIEGFIKQTSLIWKINDVPYTFYYTTEIFENTYGIDNNPTWNKPITEAITAIVIFSKNHLESFLWRPAPYTYLIALFTTVACLRHSLKSIVIALPVILNTAIVAVAIPAQDFRYLYANTLIIIVIFFLPFVSARPFSVKVKKKQEVELNL